MFKEDGVRLFVSAIAASFLLSSIGFAQETDSTGWQETLDLSLNVTQNSYSDNWTGGEAGNVSWVSAANGLFENQLSPMFNWRNTIRLAFGQTHTQDYDTKEWSKPEKSTDKIDIESVLRLTLHGIVDPYGAIRFESQFLDNSVPEKKRYINPMLLTLSSGVARKIWHRPEKDQLLSRLGIAVRQNIMRDVVYSTLISEDETDTTLVASGTETNTTTDGGLEWVTDFNITLSDKVGLLSKLSLFKALFNSEKDELEGTERADYWKAVDVNFENTLSVSVAKYLQVQLYAQLLYDKEVDLGGRFKETLSLGLTYKLF
jgi:hypothetical protein